MSGCGRSRVGVIAVAVMLLVVHVAPAQEGILPLAYVTYTDDSGYDLHVMDVNSGEIIFAASGTYYDCPHEMSPDRQWLLYSQGDSAIPLNRVLTLYHFETGTTHTLPHANLWESKWSSDSRQLAFNGEIFFPNSLATVTGLYACDVETGQVNTITDQEVQSYHFVDDQWMYTVMVENGLSVNHGDRSSTVDLPAARFSWLTTLSPDGRYIGYFPQADDPADQCLHLVSVATGETTRLRPITATDLDWSPDGNRIAYMSGDSEAVHLYDIDSWTTLELPPVPSGATVYRPRFSPDGRYVSYMVATPESPYYSYFTVHLIDVKTGTIQADITAFNHPYVPSIRWVSPTQVAYSKGQQPSLILSHDLWLYDVPTQTTIRLTDTPDVDERLACGWG